MMNTLAVRGEGCGGRVKAKSFNGNKECNLMKKEQYLYMYKSPYQRQLTVTV